MFDRQIRRNDANIQRLYESNGETVTMKRHKEKRHTTGPVQLKPRQIVAQHIKQYASISFGDCYIIVAVYREH